MKVATARPAPANANAMRSVAGIMSSAHHEWSRPRAAITPKKQVAATAPRTIAEATSPTAMSMMVIGVVMVAS
jgi:hypothetical protein